jgi:hypothetical protein
MWKSARLLKHLLLLSWQEHPAISIIVTRVRHSVLRKEAGLSLGRLFELTFWNQKVECVEYECRDAMYPGKQLIPPNNAGNPGLSEYDRCHKPCSGLLG